jgi:hypothetical protein
MRRWRALRGASADRIDAVLTDCVEDQPCKIGGQARRVAEG